MYYLNMYPNVQLFTHIAYNVYPELRFRVHIWLDVIQEHHKLSYYQDQMDVLELLLFCRVVPVLFPKISLS